MKCRDCRQSLSQAHMANAVGVKPDGTVTIGLKDPKSLAGLTEIYHRRCYNKVQRTKTDEARGRADRPTAYEASAQFHNADDVAAQARLDTVNVEEAYAAQSIHGGESSPTDDAEAETIGLDKLLD